MEKYFQTMPLALFSNLLVLLITHHAPILLNKMVLPNANTVTSLKPSSLFFMSLISLNLSGSRRWPLQTISSTARPHPPSLTHLLMNVYTHTVQITLTFDHLVVLPILGYALTLNTNFNPGLHHASF